MESILCWLESHPGTAGWMQALGAIIALAITIGLAAWQSRKAEKSAELERKKSYLQLYDSLITVTKYSESTFQSVLEDLHGEDAIAALESESWLESIFRLVKTIDSIPVHQLPDAESIDYGLDIQRFVHAISRNLTDTAQRVRLGRGGNLGPDIQLVENNLKTLSSLKEKVIARRKSFE